MVQLLLEHGAAKDAALTTDGCTPLWQAAQVWMAAPDRTASMNMPNVWE